MRYVDFSMLSDEVSIAKNFHFFGYTVVDLITGKTEDFYEKLSLPKKNKKTNGYRIVYKPKVKIEGLHKEILTHINHHSKDLVHSSAHGFIKGRGTLSNAKIHLNKKYLFQIDIESFFPSIHKSKIENVFEKLGCNHYIANLLAEICTIDDYLAEGLNTSPMLANIFFYSLDEKFLKLSNEYDCNYSRYADDMTFSSDRLFNTKELLEKIRGILNLEDLRIKDSKVNFSQYGQAQYVTGLSISNEIRPRIPKRIKKRLRQEFYYIKKYGFYSHFKHSGESMEAGHKRLAGWILYALSVEPEYGEELRKKYKAL